MRGREGGREGEGEGTEPAPLLHKHGTLLFSCNADLHFSFHFWVIEPPSNVALGSSEGVVRIGHSLRNTCVKEGSTNVHLSQHKLVDTHTHTRTRTRAHTRAHTHTHTHTRAQYRLHIQTAYASSHEANTIKVHNTYIIHTYIRTVCCICYSYTPKGLMSTSLQ